MNIFRISFSAIAISGALALSGAAFAQSRPSTVNMSCAQAQATVKSAGAIVLGMGGLSYDRFVSGASFCAPLEDATPTWAPTRDVAQCMVGFVCELRTGRDPGAP
ncbi:MAG: hypothetical protein Q8M31_11215 [Beijerinckiaceae bacterium]|nr:hypothetical protein [Beijerinckiaceae bacterium]